MGSLAGSAAAGPLPLASRGRSIARTIRLAVRVCLAVCASANSVRPVDPQTKTRRALRRGAGALCQPRGGTVDAPCRGPAPRLGAARTALFAGRTRALLGMREVPDPQGMARQARQGPLLGVLVAPLVLKGSRARHAPAALATRADAGGRRASRHFSQACGVRTPGPWAQPRRLSRRFRQVSFSTIWATRSSTLPETCRNGNRRRRRSARVTSCWAVRQAASRRVPSCLNGMSGLHSTMRS